MNQVALVIRFLAGFAILAGVIILSSSVAGTRYRRIREVAVLKTLGATRRRISAIFSVEFTILGAVGGLLGGVLANFFSQLIAMKFLETSAAFDFASVLGHSRHCFTGERSRLACERSHSGTAPS